MSPFQQFQGPCHNFATASTMKRDICHKQGHNSLSSISVSILLRIPLTFLKQWGGSREERTHELTSSFLSGATIKKNIPELFLSILLKFINFEGGFVVRTH